MLAIKEREAVTATRRTFLHVGSGVLRKAQTTPGFNSPDWDELRLDIDEKVAPDIIGTMTDMSAVPSGSVEGIFSSHNIEHLFAHEVPVALAEFLRVLSQDGFVVITCPDLQTVCKLVAEDKLTATAYNTGAGDPITPLDILYGYRRSLALGNHYMAHHCGFTLNVLVQTLYGCGFATVAAVRREPYFDLWALATKSPMSDDALWALAREHFPS
jgi:hypothetical protein